MNELNITKSTISSAAYVEDSARIEHSIIGDNCSVYGRAWLRRSRISNDCLVADWAKIDETHLAEYVHIGRGSHLYQTTMGRHSYTSQNTMIIKAELGNFCSISWGVSIGGANHDYSKITSHSMLYNASQGLLGSRPPFYDRFKEHCVINNDVWIGAGASILRGVSIGDGSVIGAGAVVTKDVEPFSIIVGNPGKLLKLRFEPQVCERLLDIKWWDLPDEIITENLPLFGSVPNEEVLDNLESIVKKRRVG